MVKFLISLVLAIVAAFTILFAGVVGGARISTMLLRALAGWFVTGAVVYLVLLIFELKGWMAFDKDIAEPPQGDLPEPDAEGDVSGEQASSAMDNVSDAASGFSDGETAETPETSGFQPMQASNLTHIEAPPES